MTEVWLRRVASTERRRRGRALRRTEEARYHRDLRPSRRQRTAGRRRLGGGRHHTDDGIGPSRRWTKRKTLAAGSWAGWTGRSRNTVRESINRPACRTS